MGSQNFQNFPDMNLIIFQCSAVDQDIIKKNDDEYIQVLLKIMCIKCMKVAGAFVKPKGKTKNSKCPYLVRNAVLGTSLG